jgi:hypothetical protein
MVRGVYTSRQQPDGSMVEVANMSRYVRDGQGDYSATVENAGGSIAHLTTTGTYTLNPDCTGAQGALARRALSRTTSSSSPGTGRPWSFSERMRPS